MLRFPIGIISIILIKTLIISPSISDALMFLGSLGFFAFVFMTEFKKEKTDEKITQDIAKLQKELTDMNGFLNSQKMAQSVRLR